MKDNDQFIVEKSIPLPEKPFRKPVKIKYPFDQMEVGDSFLVPDVAPDATMENNIVTSWLRWVHNNDSDYRFETRLLRDGVRVWRVK